MDIHYERRLKWADAVASEKHFFLFDSAWEAMLLTGFEQCETITVKEQLDWFGITRDQLDAIHSMHATCRRAQDFESCADFIRNSDTQNNRMKFYAGIGSRKTPREVLRQMWDIAVHLGDFTLRSGGAAGADICFEKAVESVGGSAEIFRPKQVLKEGIPEWSVDELRKHMDDGDHRISPEGLKPFTRAILCRNMMQVLGPNGDSPVEFIVCWTPTQYHLGNNAGGTRYACRCAHERNIPIYNLYREGDQQYWADRIAGA